MSMNPCLLRLFGFDFDIRKVLRGSLPEVSFRVDGAAVSDKGARMAFARLCQLPVASKLLDAVDCWAP